MQYTSHKVTACVGTLIQRRQNKGELKSFPQNFPLMLGSQENHVSTKLNYSDLKIKWKKIIAFSLMIVLFLIGSYK